jgi:crotonobetainyl-CoA:carnitine CoA-transferase CaiB-like acyl-CoA transferase
MGLTRVWSPHGSQFDYTAVAHVLITIFAALAHRDRTGQGSYTEIAQAEAGGAMLAPLFLQALATGQDVWPEPNDVPGSYLSGVFAAAGQDAWVAVELEDASDWDAAAALLGVPELTIGANGPPPAAVNKLKEVIAAWAQTLTPAQAARQLQAAGLAAAAVQEIADLFTDPGLWARNGLAELHLPDTDVTTWVTAPFQRMQSPRAHVRWPSPHPGQHNDEILRDWLTSQASPVSEPGPAGAGWA